MSSAEDSGNDSDSTVEYDGGQSESSESSSSSDSDDEVPVTRAQTKRRRVPSSSSSDEGEIRKQLSEDDFLDKFDESHRKRLTARRLEVTVQCPRPGQKVRDLRRTVEAKITRTPREKSARLLLNQTQPQIRKRNFRWDDEDEQEEQGSSKKQRKCFIEMLNISQKRISQVENKKFELDKSDDQSKVGMLKHEEARKVGAKKNDKKKTNDSKEEFGKSSKEARKGKRKTSEDSVKQRKEVRSLSKKNK